MSETNATNGAPIESPPPSAMPAKATSGGADAQHALHRLALELTRAHNRKLLVEFLQLRRALR